MLIILDRLTAGRMRSFAATLWLFTLIAACISWSCLAAAPAGTPDSAPMMAGPSAFADAFNHGQTALPAGVFADDATVIDEFAPFAWHGPRAVETWYGDLMGRTDEQTAKVRALHQHLTLSPAKILRVTGDSAYLVIPGVLTWTEDGAPHRQTGLWTVIERLQNGHWLIAAHAWAIDRDG